MGYTSEAAINALNEHGGDKKKKKDKDYVKPSSIKDPEKKKAATAKLPKVRKLTAKFLIMGYTSDAAKKALADHGNMRAPLQGPNKRKVKRKPNTSKAKSHNTPKPSKY